MTFKYSITATTILCTAAAALTLSSPAKAEIVLIGNDPQGWVFSTDGFLNAFVIQSHSDNVPTTNGTHGTPAFSIGNTSGSATHVTNGLMPESFGFNVKSPDLDGSKMTARLSIQPGMNNSSGKGWDGDGAGGGVPNLLREAYMTYGGSWGDFQAGKSLGIFGSQAILNDMYLFGVGAGVATQGNGQNSVNTTTGGIGYGYTYAGWNGNIRYTTPSLGGVKATVGIFEPNSIAIYDPVTVAGAPTSATKTSTPRVEGGLNYAGKMGEDTVTAWVNGTYQDATFAGTNNVALRNGYVGNYANKSVSVYAGELGGKLVHGPFDFVAHAYAGEGMGVSGAQLSFDSLDMTGDAILGYGYYLQGQYHFGQGTSVALRYGSSYQNETSFQEADRAARTAVTLTEKDLAGAQVYHVVNKYLRVVSEYDYVTNSWADGTDQHEHIAAIGLVATY